MVAVIIVSLFSSFIMFKIIGRGRGNFFKRQKKKLIGRSFIELRSVKFQELVCGNQSVNIVILAII